MTELRRLHPDPGPVDLDEVLDELVAGGERRDRPRVLASMISSVDGRAAPEDDPAALGGPTDRAMLDALRARVDAVLVGARSASGQSTGRLVPDPEARAARVSRGLHPEPIALVLSPTGEPPADAPSLSDPEARPVMLSGHAGPAAALRRAGEEHGVRTVLCEGGAALNGALLAERVIDEILLTVSPLVLGGGEPLSALGAEVAAAPMDLELRWVLEAGDCLFLRYSAASAGDG